MHLSARHDSVTLHPILARFVHATTQFTLPSDLSGATDWDDLAGFTTLQIHARDKHPNAAPGYQLTLCGPLLPLLFWPAPEQLPPGLPLVIGPLPDPVIAQLLCAELLRCAKLCTNGAIPEWVRKILNLALEPSQRQQLFGQSGKLSQQTFAAQLGLSRSQLAHQARSLIMESTPSSPMTVTQTALFKRWLAEPSAQGARCEDSHQ